MTILNSQYGETKKKSLALKDSSHEEEDNEEEDDDDEESEDENEGLEFLLREFNKFHKERSRNWRTRANLQSATNAANLGISNQIAKRIKRRRNTRRNIKHIFHGKTKMIPPPPPVKTKTPTFVS
ncbi:hypothetical protein PIB30_007729 [Stylosanthes scabra]|uniref:Uncharacterized protein n=1 Tax=Stylosanthes scabra TaxID=79078 RepID=A0ABU6Y6A6_9FABA|nr:hypothetical protein [Stylosanthes scabra]